jgi:hypothetical protein
MGSEHSASVDRLTEGMRAERVADDASNGFRRDHRARGVGIEAEVAVGSDAAIHATLDTPKGLVHLR